MELLECSVSKYDKVSGPFMVIFLISQLYVSGVWFSVDVRMDTKKCIRCSKEIGLHAQNLITILGSRESSTQLGGDLYDHLMSTRIFILTMIKIFT